MATLRSLIESQPTTPSDAARQAQAQAAQTQQARDRGGQGLDFNPGLIPAAASGAVRVGNSLGVNPEAGGVKLSDLLGPIDLASGIIAEDPKKIAAGGLRTAGSVANLAGYPGVGGALGAVGGPLSIGFALSDGVGPEDIAPIVSGTGATLAAVPAVAGLATGTTAAGAAAASGAVAAAGAAGSVISIAAIPIAIGLMNMQRQAANKIKQQTTESKYMREGLNKNIPVLRQASETAQSLHDIESLPPDQQVAAYQAALTRLEDGIGTISQVFQPLDANLSGGKASKIKPIPEEQKQKMWDQLDPMLTDTLLGYVHAADALAQRGVEVKYTPGRNLDPVSLANQLAQKAGAPHMNNAVESDSGNLDRAAPGNLGRSLDEYFLARNPGYKDTALYRRAAEIGRPSLASAEIEALINREVEVRNTADQRGRVAQTLVDAFGYVPEVDEALAGGISMADARKLVMSRGRGSTLGFQSLAYDASDVGDTGSPDGGVGSPSGTGTGVGDGSDGVY